MKFEKVGDADWLVRPDTAEEMRFLTILRDLHNADPKIAFQVIGSQNGPEQRGMPPKPVTCLRLKAKLPPRTTVGFNTDPNTPILGKGSPEPRTIHKTTRSISELNARVLRRRP
jgi:hypothetical protein